MDMNAFSLQNKIAWVTGGSYGIGFAIAEAFAAAGATIVFNDIRQELVDKGLTAYAEKGIRAHGYVCDVTSEEQVNAMVAQIEKEVGIVDILVNNAGITRDGLILTMKEEDFDTVTDVNLKGTFNMIRHCAGVFIRAKEGCIINISSVSGLMGNAGQCNYAASKAGIVGLTKSAAKELASKNIRCNAIAPGFIVTDMTRDQEDNPIVRMIPLGRMGDPEDVAEAAVYLATASYVTGEVLRVDGGIAM